jgi:hypothetical protein
VSTASAAARDVERTGQHDGRLELAQLIDLGRAGELAEAVPTTIAAGTFSRNRLPPWARIAVTPVLIESPCVMVVCPTRIPGDVGDGIERPRGDRSDADSDVAGAGTLSL